MSFKKISEREGSLFSNHSRGFLCYANRRFFFILIIEVFCVSDIFWFYMRNGLRIENWTGECADVISQTFCKVRAKVKMISYPSVEVSIIITINLFLSDQPGTLPIFLREMVYFMIFNIFNTMLCEIWLNKIICKASFWSMKCSIKTWDFL